MIVDANIIIMGEPTDKNKLIQVPEGTSKWGKSLIVNLEKSFETMTNRINANFEKHHADLKNTLLHDIQDIRTKAEEAITIASEAKTAITTLKSDMEYMKFHMESLSNANNKLQIHATRLENHSRRNNLVIYGFQEEDTETNAALIRKIQHFCTNNLKMNQTVVSNIKFERVHRLGPKHKKTTRNTKHVRPRGVIVKFRYYTDKELIWAQRGQLAGNYTYSMSENYASVTEFNRKKLFPIYKLGKGIPKYANKISLSVDKLIVDSVPYDVDSLESLPPELHPNKLSVKQSMSAVVFGGVYSYLSELSNWYDVRRVGGNIDLYDQNFCSSEQAYVYKKALHANNHAAAKKVMFITDPREVKTFGNSIEGLDSKAWDTAKLDIMKEINLAKFSQNDQLKKALLATGTMEIVEGGLDTFWAAGAPFTSKSILQPTTWTGANKLGMILVDIRTQLAE